MMYLIGQLAVWLLLTALFAALAGWAFAAEQAAAKDARHQKDRDKLVTDLSGLASGAVRSEGVITPDAESARSLSAIRESRIAELERAHQEQRARADGLAAQLAEEQRGGAHNDEHMEELQRLRTQVAAHEEERARIVDIVATPAEPTEPNEDAALQTWRLRYFERRVKYLENLPPPAAQAAAPVVEAAAHAIAPPVDAWRAREAEARANFLADELRRAQAPTAPEAPAPSEAATSPFAANADVDALLRWRMLYLERRVAHLQTEQPAPVVVTPTEARSDPDRWKWRARYLEARVRHLEQRPVAAPVQTVADIPTVVAEEERAPPPAAPTVPEERPPGLPAAQGGAPDDFTLIDLISPLQQTTLYSLGIYHFDQIAAWTPANVAWVDRYLRLQGRIEAEEWLEQAADLAREGPDAARRRTEEEDA
jgi:predicted flap endonuclease-1-like 5' DNA nuclease